MPTKSGNDLAEWTDISNKFDMAIGYFEIGSLRALDGKWQKLDQIRILMGDEVNPLEIQKSPNGIEMLPVGFRLKNK